jgi:hypothetical protein
LQQKAELIFESESVFVWRPLPVDQSAAANVKRTQNRARTQKQTITGSIKAWFVLCLRAPSE